MESGGAPQWLSPRDYFRRAKRHPRKRFGQNFLDQPQTAQRIVDALDIGPADTVVEVGPGLGALTRHLLGKTSHLVLVELDPELVQYLSLRLAGQSDRVSLHCQDVLSIPFDRLKQSDLGRLLVIGNLPYNISSPLLFRLLESRSALDRCVFMVQLEVGERLAAGSGTRQYGVLSVLLGCYAHVRLLFRIGPKQFFPRPRVDSVVLEIDFTCPPLEDPPPFTALRRVVSTAFSQRRKMLKNTLKPFFEGGDAAPDELLRSLDLDPGCRPETLNPEQYARLTRKLLSLPGASLRH